MNQKLISLNAVHTALVRLAGLALPAFSVSVAAVPAAPTLSSSCADEQNVALTKIFIRYTVTGTSMQYRILVSQNI